MFNGAVLVAEDSELYPQYLRVADGSFDEAAFAAWRSARIVAKPAGKVQEKRARYRR